MCERRPNSEPWIGYGPDRGDGKDRYVIEPEGIAQMQCPTERQHREPNDPALEPEEEAEMQNEEEKGQGEEDEEDEDAEEEDEDTEEEDEDKEEEDGEGDDETEGDEEQQLSAPESPCKPVADNDIAAKVRALTCAFVLPQPCFCTCDFEHAS